MSDVCTTDRYGRRMVWNGHLCEGAQMVPNNPDTFLLWTRCGKHDMPASKARRWEPARVTCPECAAIAAAEPRHD